MHWRIHSHKNNSTYYAFHPTVKNYLTHPSLLSLLRMCRSSRHSLEPMPNHVLHYYYITKDETNYLFTFNDRKHDSTIVNEYPELFI